MESFPRLVRESLLRADKVHRVMRNHLPGTAVGVGLPCPGRGKSWTKDREGREIGHLKESSSSDGTSVAVPRGRGEGQFTGSFHGGGVLLPSPKAAPLQSFGIAKSDDGMRARRCWSSSLIAHEDLSLPLIFRFLH